MVKVYKEIFIVFYCMCIGAIIALFDFIYIERTKLLNGWFCEFWQFGGGELNFLLKR